MAIKEQIKKVAAKIKGDNERGARQNLIEELFYDFNRSRVQVYKMNFFRGIFFGLGSVLGGTIVVALIIWMLSLLTDIFPMLSDFFNGVSNTIESDT